MQIYMILQYLAIHSTFKNCYNYKVTIQIIKKQAFNKKTENTHLT